LLTSQNRVSVISPRVSRCQAKAVSWLRLFKVLPLRSR
jgi:hypothetical protein